MNDVRVMPIPDGLQGERIDAALSRLFGLSRTRGADLASEGLVSVNGQPVAKSHRVNAGDLLEVTLAASPRAPRSRSSPNPCRA